jgi:hypothetical protein
LPSLPSRERPRLEHIAYLFFVGTEFQQRPLFMLAVAADFEVDDQTEVVADLNAVD